MKHAAELTSASKAQSSSILQRYSTSVICGIVLGLGMAISVVISDIPFVVPLLFALFAGAIFPIVFLGNTAPTPWRKIACYVGAALLSSYWLLCVYVGGAASLLALVSLLKIPLIISAVSVAAVTADNKRKYRRLSETQAQTD